MRRIPKLIEKYIALFESKENQRRLSLWDRIDESIRGETQWHGMPSPNIQPTDSMPVTAECLEKIWEDSLGLDLEKYYTDPKYFLEYYLKTKIKKFNEFPDDTLLTMNISVAFGVTHEAGMLGQEVFLKKD